MIEPVDVAMGKDGKIYIGDITYINGEPVSSKPVEMTSQGAHINGLDAYKIISAGYCCHITPLKQAYIKPVYEQIDGISSPVVNIKNGTTVGFRYLQFGAIPPKSVTITASTSAEFTVNLRLDSYKGRIISKINTSEKSTTFTADLTAGIIGRHAVYFEFLSESGEATAEFIDFTFDI